MRIKIIRLLIVLGGIVAGQFILFGPSLTGQKILLPLDVLGMASVYLPAQPQFAHDYAQSDLVEQWEPARLFAISEFHAGRLPMWNPYQYTGCPVIWPKFSPFFLLDCCTASPVILAWTQLFAAVIAGLGAYYFFRRSLRVSFWAAAIPAWCYPLTGFFVFWQGAPSGYPIFWLPWALLAVDQTIRRANGYWPIALGIVTGLVLVSGALDTAGQVLLISGIYAAWRIWDRYRREWFRRAAQRVVAVLVLGWSLGFLLAAPYLMPLLEYSHTGARMSLRAGGKEERPPIGLSALPQIVLPDIFGTSRIGSLRLAPQVQAESGAAAYAGLFAALLAAPLAWCNRRHRSASNFWALLGFFGLSWSLNVPGLVALLRLPGLNMMSHNRLVFVTAFAILTLAAIGLDALGRGQVRPQRYFLLPVTLLGGMFAWCNYRIMVLPEPIATELAGTIARHQTAKWIEDLQGVARVQAWFSASYVVSAILCGVGLIGWWWLWKKSQRLQWAVPLLGILMLADMFWFAHDRSAQCEWSLYYPPVPALEAVAKSAPGRVIAKSCLPAALAQTQGLRDICGYDGVDPERLLELLAPARSTRTTEIAYANLQWFSPRFHFEPPDKIELSPVLDMLDVRYVIFRGTPQSNIHPPFQSTSYSVFENRQALPRGFVPKHVEVAPVDAERLEKLASPEFNPRETAYVETPVNLPEVCVGRAEITSEIPTRITMSVQMETPGLIVLADLWDKGWQAYLNGTLVPILHVNHAVRGVIVPAGAGTLEFKYASASFRMGLHCAEVAFAILILWFVIVVWLRRPAS